MRSVGAAHKNMEAPRSINKAMPEGFGNDRLPVWGFRASTTEPRMTKISRSARNDDTKSEVSWSPSLIPNPQLLIPAFNLQGSFAPHGLTTLPLAFIAQ